MPTSFEQNLAGRWEDLKGNIFIFSFLTQSDGWHLARVTFSKEVSKEFSYCIQTRNKQPYLLLKNGAANFIEFDIVTTTATTLVLRQENTALQLLKQS